MLKYVRESLAGLLVLVLAASVPSSLSSAIRRDDTADYRETLQPETGFPYKTQSVVKDAPGVEEQIIEPGDVIAITVKGYEEDYNQVVVVQPNGNVKYLSLGEIQAAGLTVSEFENKLKEELRIKISDPQVKASVQQKEYIIQPGDVISITVEGYDDYNQESIVQPEGKIEYMSFGEIQAAGLTAPQLVDEIVKRLKPGISDPQVSISVRQAEPTLKKEEVEEKAVEAVEKEKPEEAELKPKVQRIALIRPGDVVDIVVVEHGDYSRVVVVQPNGKITYPPLGEIQAAEYTEERLSQEIAAGLSRYIANPRVMVAITGTVEYDRAEFGVIDPSSKAEEIEVYFIKPRDVINIEVVGRGNYDHAAAVQTNGSISYPPLGEIQAAGLTAAQLAETISLGLSAFIGSPEVLISLGRYKSIPEGLQRAEAAPPALVRRFGQEFFAGARNRILKLEESLAEATGEIPSPSAVRDAISGFVGPIDMMSANVAATIPVKYVLGPGDRLTLRFWSDVLELQTVSLIVDGKGEVIVPKVGRMVVRGMTLAQFQEAAREEMTRAAYRDLKLIASLGELRSIQIFIAGEAFRPGGYSVSAVTTLFNALYMCGGPSDRGSLRNIKLLRSGGTNAVDFYRFLIDGDSEGDFILDSGDTIFIPQLGRTVAVFGEVKRPAEYELKEGENLLELISLAGGVRSSGLLQRVQIDSVSPARERVIIDVDLSAADQPDTPLLDGDVVTVFSIPSERMNVVTLEGKVRMPGVYQLKEGMRVSDLIWSARGLLGEAYRERADLVRLNPDQKTTTLIPVDLSKALAGSESNDVILEQWDKLLVYSRWDVKWAADRVVSIHGAVQRPGSYERSDSMTVDDLLIRSGGALPDAYLDKAILMRLDERGKATKGIPLNLKGSGRDFSLEDGDTLVVYTHREARWESDREVAVDGAVQNPGTFTRVDDMRISDLIEKAGGFLPGAFPDRALLLRLNERQQIAQGFFISPALALQNDPGNNISLKDGDRLIIYTYEEATWEPKREVTAGGAVLLPGTFERVDGMRVSDLLQRAGGLLPNAYLERADISRFLPDYETHETVPVNLSGVLSGDEGADILLQDEDLLTVYTIREVQYKPENIVTIHGMVQRPGEYVRTIGMKLSDLLFASGGLLPGAHESIEVARISEGNVVILTASATGLAEGNEREDILLEDEDIVSVRRQKQFLDALRTVTLSGEVKYPGDYILKHNERLSGLIQRAGGLTDRAYPEASVITRHIDYLALNEQRKSMQQVRKLFDDLSEQEYRRELAKAALEGKRRESDEGQKVSSTKKSAFSYSTPVVSSAEEAAKIAAITSIPGQAEAAVTAAEEIAAPQYTIVTPARKIDSFLPSGRLIVDLKEAMKNPGAKDDMILEDGDAIAIPAMSTSISVSGAVIQPSSLAYFEGRKIEHYIEMVGGYSRDADAEAVYVIKANGLVVASDKARLSPGDIIVVPTKVMVQKVVDRWAQVISAVKFTVTTLAMVYSIRLIVKNI